MPWGRAPWPAGMPEMKGHAADCTACQVERRRPSLAYDPLAQEGCKGSGEVHGRPTKRMSPTSIRATEETPAPGSSEGRALHL